VQAALTHADPGGDPEELGDLVARLRDSEGEVQIYALGRLRTLTFGNSVEQSRIDLDHPERLVHVYTRAMLLGLILAARPTRVLVLGLGGGSLVQALLAADPALAVDACEARALVVDVAREYLTLPRTARLKVSVGDALTHVQTTPGRYDLILVDLYGAEGMHPDQGNGFFLRACGRCLRRGGLLVSNHWSGAFPENRRAHAALAAAFPGGLLHLHVAGGNSIAFAFPETLPRLDPTALYERAQALGLRLEIPLQPLARNLWRQNAEALQGRRRDFSRP
jgi:spermidine synthase